MRLEEGLAFELNNVVPHEVENAQGGERVHLILDLMRSADKKQWRPLKAGQSCEYARGGKIVCEPSEKEGLADGRVLPNLAA